MKIRLAEISQFGLRITAPLMLFALMAGCAPKALPPRADVDLSALESITSSSSQRQIGLEIQYADNLLKNYAGLQRQLLRQSKAVTRIDSESTNIQIGKFHYYTRSQEGQSLPVLYRSSELGEELLLDLNDLTLQFPNLVLGEIRINPNSEHLAISIDFNHSGNFELQLKNIKTGRLTSLHISNVNDFEWNSSGDKIFYTKTDNKHRPSELYLTGLNSVREGPKLLYKEADLSLSLLLNKSKSGRFLFLTSEGLYTNEVRFLDLEADTRPLTLLINKTAGVKYYADHHAGTFLLRTNRNSANYQLLSVPVSWPTSDKVQTELELDRHTSVEGLECFDTFYVAYLRRNGKQEIEIHNYFSDKSTLKSPSNLIGTIGFKESFYKITQNYNPNFHATNFRFSYESPTAPRQIYQFDTLSQKLFSIGPVRTENKKFYDRRFTLPGSKVPLVLISKDEITSSPRPTVVFVYGAYGKNLEASFSQSRLNLLERNINLAYCMVRGGGEFGEEWHVQGSLLNKQNSISDLIDCANFLINNKYVTAGQLGVWAKSAGGATVAAALNQAPGLFKVAILDSPFLDVTRSMQKPELPLTEIEYQEWGDPNNLLHFKYLRSWDPILNLKTQDYPSIFVSIGLKDWIVPYWNSLKWAAKLRSLRTDNNPVILNISVDGDHSAASSVEQGEENEAWKNAFLIKNLSN